MKMALYDSRMKEPRQFSIFGLILFVILYNIVFLAGSVHFDSPALLSPRLIVIRLKAIIFPFSLSRLPHRWMKGGITRERHECNKRSKP